MTLSLKSSLALAASLLLLGCNKEGGATTSAPVAPLAAAGALENPSQPVASYNGVTITLKDVDTKISAQLKKWEKEKLQARQQTAESIALEALVKAEAAKVGKTEDEWLKEKIQGQLPAPNEAEILKVFEENKAQMPPGSTLESMREQIIGFLQKDQRRDVAMKLFEGLKTQANYKLLLEEPRVVVEAKGPGRGPEGAPITIVEFSDFECPFCSRAEDAVTQVMEKYAGKIRLVFRHYPLPFHANAPKAAEASACANEQGKFWEMHKQLFANQQKLGVADLKAHAQAIGLEAGKFAECLDSGKMKAVVDADYKAGSEVGVNGTPAFFINGKLLSGAQPFGEFQKVIDAELKAKGG